MVRAIREDWDETGSLPLAEAHRRHLERAMSGGFGGPRGEDIASHREAVIERARRQERQERESGATGRRADDDA